MQKAYQDYISIGLLSALFILLFLGDTRGLSIKGDITPFAFMGLEFTPHIFASETGEVSVP